MQGLWQFLAIYHKKCIVIDSGAHHCFYQGLGRVKSRLGEDALDAPHAPAAFEKLVKQGQADGWLPADFASKA
jgi:hypothetical protein